MIERQLPDRDPGLAPHTPPDGEPEIKSPDVNSQDVEHDARPETRVNNTGVPVKPKPRETESILEEDVTKLPPD
jgi:hypothetical protein